MTDLPQTATTRKLKSYLSLPVGWNYGKGGPIQSDIIDLAVIAEAMLRDAGLPETDCFPGCDGEVQVCGYRPTIGQCVTVEISSDKYEPSSPTNDTPLRMP